jgi:predicted nucleotidyltransferase
METEKKIIRNFLENKNPKTIREIALAIKSDYKITHIAVQRLVNKNILLLKKIGKSSLCELNNLYFDAEIYEAEEQRKNNLLKNKNLYQVYKEINSRIKTSFFVFLVFGSYAKGTQEKNSDIDLMFVSNEKDFEKEIHSIVSLLPLDIHSLVFTESEFINMKDSKKENVIKEALNNHIILYGAQNFYKMKNA